MSLFFGPFSTATCWVTHMAPKIMHSKFVIQSLTIIPRARMGYESIAHEAEDRMGYWLRGYEGERNNCFSKIQLVAQKKYRE